jgi:hypothetical protein
MRLRLTVAILALAAAARAEPLAAPGYALTPVETNLEMPSGLALDGEALVATDLATGRVVRIGAAAAAVDLTPPLPTGRDVMGEPTGPYKVRVLEGRTYVSQGWSDVDRGEGALDHAILALGGRESAEPRVVGNDFWNPYDFEWAGDGWFVADAARNALVRIPVEGGPLEQVFAFPRLKHRETALGSLSPTEFKSDEIYQVDAVPTGLAVSGPRVYVALFGGFPFIERGGVVVSVPVDGQARRARREVKDLNAPIDVAFAADGRLLVLELGVFDLDKGFLPGTGELIAVDLATGASEVLLSGLGLPVTVEPLPGGGALVAQMVGGIVRLSQR